MALGRSGERCKCSLSELSSLFLYASFMAKLPQISRFLVSTLEPEDWWWDLCWSSRSSARGKTRWGNLLSQPRLGEGKHMVLLSTRNKSDALCFIYLSHPKSLQRQWFSPASALAAFSPPHQKCEHLQSKTCSPSGPRHVLPTQNKSLRPPL